MNKKFKRALSSILAFILVFSTLTVMNVSNVFAADYNDYDSVTTSDDLTTKTWDFSSNMPGSNINCDTGDTVLGIVVDAVGSRFRISGSSSPYLSITDATFSIPVPTGSAGTITMTNQSTTTDRHLTLNNTNTQLSLSSSGAVYTFTADKTSDGYLGFTASGGEVKLQRIEVVLTTSEFEADTSITYTITGSTNVANTSITVGTYEATTDANGNYTIKKSVEDGEDAPFANGDILAVTAPEYDSQNTTLTVDASDSTVFTASAVTLTKYTLTALADGEYTSFLLPDFEAGSDFSTTASTKNKFTGSMNFVIDSPKEVTFAVSCGSSTSGRSATFTLKDSDETTIATSGSMVAGTDTKSATITVYLEAGTYTMVGESDDSTLQVTSVTVKSIAIFGITADEQSGSDSYYIAEEGGDAIVSDSTVYTGIAFDSGDADAADLVSGASYVVAYVVKLTTGNSIDNLKIHFE